jgi:hypothetical protein
MRESERGERKKERKKERESDKDTELFSSLMMERSSCTHAAYARTYK